MSLTTNTPGVYVQEVSTLPASVAAVETAIPAFIGYTEKAVRDGVTLANNTPVRITSMVEYEDIFGGAQEILFDVTLTDAASGTTDSDTSQIAITDPGTSNFSLYYNMRQFFANGGGPCYIVSVGAYSSDDSTARSTALQNGVTAVEVEDEVTLLVCPDAAHLVDAGDVYGAMRTQCTDLQDRFAIFDVATSGNVDDDASAFRGLSISGEARYSAAYYPSFETTINRAYDETAVDIADNRTSAVYNSDTLNILREGKTTGGTGAAADLTVAGDMADGDTITIGTTVFTAKTTASAFNDFAIVTGDFEQTAINLAAAINLGLDGVTASIKAGTPTQVDLKADKGTEGNMDIDLLVETATVTASGHMTGGTAQTVVKPDLTLYNRILAELAQSVTLHPAATMAGVYARVDASRGVWKAPANVTVSGIKSFDIAITDAEQEGLNVDATAGKSINALRHFTGKGNLVWGARTMAGNDAEWRYVPVRRLYIMVEESIKKATEFVVFEPNDANTWTRTRAMIQNFLSDLWRQGALAGATPEQAYFVNIGLGETMTPQDILEGKLIIEIGMAAVRPAEFIILRFSHKLQES